MREKTSSFQSIVFTLFTLICQHQVHGAAMCDEDDAERSQQRRLKTYADFLEICFGFLPPFWQGLLI
ncbi:Hypothetical protein PMT_2317 [Prochlorococcus marinus str. MIT 9313]|uniref:Uncharacterized protein n=1 Tax=Prochlorococcus marinus (strain MIT 9313) TaxID=74547 RepID=B9ERE9_PROMM|nr:Hypothetical protein PMT_2317 [Prochlorococcus marinus str. MIT 9313]